MAEATNSDSSNGLSGVKGWLLFLCITLVFLLPILKAGSTLYSMFLINGLSDIIETAHFISIEYGQTPEAFTDDLATEKEKEAARRAIPLIPEIKKSMQSFCLWLLLLIVIKTACTMMGFFCGILLWMKKPFGAKLLKIYPIAILLGVFVCFISLIYWRSNHPVLFSLQEIFTGFYEGGTLIENLFASPNVLVAILSLLVVVPSVLWASTVFIYSRKSKRMQATYPDAYKGSLSIPMQGAGAIARDPIETDESISALDDEVSTAGSPKVAEDHSRKSVGHDLQQMSSSCPQCNAAVQPGEIRCTQCGTHLYGMQPASSGGTFKLIAVLGGSIIGFAAISGIIIFLMEGTGRNKRAQFNERVGADQMALNERIEKIERFRGRKFTPEMVRTAVKKLTYEMHPDRPGPNHSEEKLGKFNAAFDSKFDSKRIAQMTEELNRAIAVGEITLEETSVKALEKFLRPRLSDFVSEGTSKARAKANRIRCVNNLGNVYKAGLAFAQDNGERLPWQLTPSGVRFHLDSAATASEQYGRQTNPNINEVMAHPYSLAAAGVYGLTTMKTELVTPKILFSPCDSARTKSNEVVQENWGSYNTKEKGINKELAAGSSYVLIRGADTQRPSSVYATTRNWNAESLNTGKWLGFDSHQGNPRVIEGLNISQGQCVTMDGGAKQSTNADFGAGGNITKAANFSKGGVAKGRTSLNIIRGPGL